MPDFLESLDALRPYFEQLCGELQLWSKRSPANESETKIILDFFRKCSKAYLDKAPPEEFYAERTPLVAEARGRFKEVLQPHIDAFPSAAQQRFPIDNPLFLDALQGHFGEATLTLDNMIYFWLAMMANHLRISEVRECPPLSGRKFDLPKMALTVFLVLQDIMKNPLEMNNISCAAAEPENPVTREAYKAFLKAGRADKLAGGQFYDALWAVLRVSVSCYAEQPSIGLTNIMQRLAQEQRFPFRNNHYLYPLWVLSTFFLTGNVVVFLNDLFNAEGFQQQSTNTQQTVLVAYHERVFSHLSVTPSIRKPPIAARVGSSEREALESVRKEVAERVISIVENLEILLRGIIADRIAFSNEIRGISDKVSQVLTSAQEAGTSASQTFSSVERSPLLLSPSLAQYSGALFSSHTMPTLTVQTENDSQSHYNPLWFITHPLKAFEFVRRNPNFLERFFQPILEQIKRAQLFPTQLIDIIEQLREGLKTALQKAETPTAQLSLGSS